MEIIVAVTGLLPFVLISHYLLRQSIGDLFDTAGTCALSLGLGLGMVCFAMFALGVLQMYDALILWAIIGISYALAILLFGKKSFIVLFRNIANVHRAFIGESVLNKTLLIFLVMLILFNILGAYIPQTDIDTLRYHFGMPKLFMKHGGLFYYPYNHTSIFPFNIEMLFMFGMLLKNDICASFFNVIVGVVFAFMIYNLIKEYLGHDQGLFWGVVFYSMPFTMTQSQGGYVDMGTGMFAISGFYILIIGIRKHLVDYKLCVIAGIFFGLAGGSKLFGMISGFLAALVFFSLFVTQERKKTLICAFLVLFVTLLIASPWYVRSYAHTGNPVYPAFYNLFGGKYWDRETDEQMKVVMNTQKRPIGRSMKGMFWAPFFPFYPKLICDLMGNNEGGDHRPYLTFLPVLFAPFGLLAFVKKRPRKDLVFVLIVISLFLLIWYFVLLQRERHLAPIYGLIFLISAFGLRYVFKNLRNGILSMLATMSCVAWLVFATGVYSYFYIPKAYGAFDREGYLDKFGYLYKSIKWVNSNLSKQTKILILSSTGGYYFDIPYITTYTPALQNKFRLYAYDSPEELYDFLVSENVTHLFVDMESRMKGVCGDLLRDTTKTKLIHKENEQWMASQTRRIVGSAVRVGIFELITCSEM